METLSKLSTLEKRELHIPSGVITQAQAGTLLDDELAYYDNITSNQELDILEAGVDYQMVIISASEEGIVGLYVPSSCFIGRKSTGGIVAIPPQAHEADPTGGAVVDTEARATIVSLLAKLEALGFLSSS